MSETTKICSECGIEKPVQRYQRRTDSIDGYQAMCKLCVSMDQRNRRQKFHHGDTVVNEMMRMWR